MTRATLALFLALFAPAAVQATPTETEQRFACMGDAFRLCSQFIPDRDQIRRCLGKQRAALSEGCRPVYDASEKAFEASTHHK